MKEKLIQYIPDFYIHDEIVALVAHTFGEVLFLDKPLMLYRIHENNVIGFKKSSWFSRIMSLINNTSYIVLPSCAESKRSFYDFYEKEMKMSSELVFKSYFKYLKSNIFIQVWIVINSRMTKFRFYLLIKTLLVKIYPSDEN